MLANSIRKLAALILLVSMVIPGSVLAQPTSGLSQLATSPVSFTILHTNDFHGQLESSGSNPGIARVATIVNGVRSEMGKDSVLLVDAGDEIQGSLLSNLERGAPTVASFSEMGYGVATFGNHEFDWGRQALIDRTTQATYPFVTANIVQGSCDPSNWTPPAFAQPYVIREVGPVGNKARVAFIGVTTTETPIITIASATAGLCFKDPAESILHYYDALKAQSDVIVVLSHLGFTDGGYGYGIPAYGDQTLADKLFRAGKPVSLIIGGHSHTDVSAPAPVVDGATTVVQARYNGRQVGRADLEFDPTTRKVTVNWRKLAVPTTGAMDPVINGLVTGYVNDPAYQAQINQPIGYVQVDLLRNYNGDNMMGDLVDDAIYNALNNDGDPTNDVDLVLNNAGGLRIDWCANPDPVNPGSYVWSSTASDCTTSGLWSHDPMLLNYGQMFSILPFGNATVVGKMTGAQVMEVLNQSATLNKGAIQPAGIHYEFYRYSDALPGPQPFAWGAFDACVLNQTTHNCDPLDPNRTYRVGTNEFLAPGGGDGFSGFRRMTDITYWGDMLNVVNGWMSANYTLANPYRGPNGDGTLDGRILRVDDYDVAPPTITIGSPTATTYLHPDFLTLDFSAVDVGPTGLRQVTAALDGQPVTTRQVIDLYTLSLGDHTLTVSASDRAGNSSSKSVTFGVRATVQSLVAGANRLSREGKMDDAYILNSLTAKLRAAQASLDQGQTTAAVGELQALINEVKAQSGNHIAADAADLLIADAQWAIGHIQ